MSDLQKPGETPNKPGEYTERGPRGGEVSNERIVHMPPGDKPLPPTQQPGHKWERTSPPRPGKGSK